MPALPRPITIFVQLPALKPFSVACRCTLFHSPSCCYSLASPAQILPPPRPSLRFLVPSTPITTSQLASALAVIDFFLHHTRTFEKKKKRGQKKPSKKKKN